MLKVTKNQDFNFSLEDSSFEKLLGVEIDPLRYLSRVKVLYWVILYWFDIILKENKL